MKATKLSTMFHAVRYALMSQIQKLQKTHSLNDLSASQAVRLTNTVAICILESRQPPVRTIKTQDSIGRRVIVTLNTNGLFSVVYPDEKSID